jgi:putative ABC transport system substrate-binding protein
LLALTLDRFEINAPDEQAPAFQLMQARATDAVYIPETGVLIAARSRVLEFAGRHRIPSIHTRHEAVAAGGLLSYFDDDLDTWRRMAWYVNKVLRGAHPRDLPVGQPTKFRLAINLKTAKALGLTIPQSLLLRADEVIQ